MKLDDQLRAQFPLLSKSCRKSRKSRPPFLSKCGGNIGKIHRRYVNQCCFHIRPGVSLHPSLAAPFLFSPGLSILSISQQYTCFVRKSEKSPDIITTLLPILLRHTVRTCPKPSDIVTTLQIKYLIHFVRKSTVFRKVSFFVMCRISCNIS